MNYLLMVVPCIIAFYTVTYGLWAWRRGNRAGGVGVFCLALVVLAISVYGLFFRSAY